MNESFAFQGFSTTQPQIMCVVDGDDIIQVDYFGNRKAIGKTTAAYSELEQTTTEYYEKLVAMGVIVPPKTPEEEMADMRKMVSEMYAMMAAMEKKVSEVTSCGSPANNAGSRADVPRVQSERRSGKSSGDNAKDAEHSGRSASGS